LGAGRRFGTVASRIRNPRFAAAQQECAADIPHGGLFGYPFSKTTIEVLDAYVACVAKNGYRLPTPNTSGNGPVFPPSIQTDPGIGRPRGTASRSSDQASSGPSGQAEG
jgi:hypothetical protein